MMEPDMTKVEVLIERLTKPSKRRRTKPGYVNCAKAREAQQLQRRERLEQERPSWEEHLVKNRGNITATAAKMGYSIPAARLAILDLGLWPLMVRARNERKGEL